MRMLFIVTVVATLFYSMTCVVYEEGGFNGALVVKPYPTGAVAVGGGESENWARHHPGQPPPWFMDEDLRVISTFSWEDGGSPAWVTAYFVGFLATLLAWIVLAALGVFTLVKILMGRDQFTSLFNAGT